MRMVGQLDFLEDSPQPAQPSPWPSPGGRGDQSNRRSAAALIPAGEGTKASPAAPVASPAAATAAAAASPAAPARGCGNRCVG